MQSFAAFEDGALSYARLQELIAEFGVLFDPQSSLHRRMAASIDFVYVVDRLQMMYAHELSRRLAETLLASRNPSALLLEAKILQQRGQGQRADRLLLAALEAQPGNRTAAYLLLRGRGDALLDGSLPERLRPHLDDLPGVARAVIESMQAARSRDLSAARQYDELLAEAQPFEQWYLNAAKLRADWRIVAARNGESREHAVEALAIIDEAIALWHDINFYGMRMAAAYLADDYDAVVETARRMVWLVRQDFEFRSGASGLDVSAAELSRTLLRLESMRTGLSIARTSGRVADYKFASLDQSLSTLRQEIENYAAQ